MLVEGAKTVPCRLEARRRELLRGHRPYGLPLLNIFPVTRNVEGDSQQMAQGQKSPYDRCFYNVLPGMQCRPLQPI
jgi:hypothetical protein